jgi:hypothetical protein
MRTKTARLIPLAARAGSALATRGCPRVRTKSARLIPLAARAGCRALVRDVFAHSTRARATMPP